MLRPTILTTALAAALAVPSAHAITLIATGSLAGNLSDLSSITSGPLENGVAGNLLGGLGSGLAWAGGNTFLGLPDRGPNATTWNASVADTASYIPRFQTLTLALTVTPGGALPFTLTPMLNSTTLLYSSTPLNYGSAPSLVGGGNNYFTGRSDAFDPTKNSLNPANARLDTESIRVSNDGRSVFVSDEYGPYVYQFDRATGERIRTFTLPSNLAVATPGPTTASEGAPTNTSGRVANKGMEGLAITPDGTMLVGMMQSALLQDGGDGAQYNRLVTIDIATGTTHEYAFNNQIGGKNYNNSEILALNNHEFLVLERDGKGLGDDSSTKFKQVLKVDIAGAQTVDNDSGATALGLKAVNPSLFLDLKATLNAYGITDDKIPAKLEGMAFGDDVLIGGQTMHTLFVANDNDFLSVTPGGLDNPNQWFVFAFNDADLKGSAFVPQLISTVPEPASWALMGIGLLVTGGFRRRATRAG